MSAIAPLFPAAHLEAALAAAGRQPLASARASGTNGAGLPSLGRAGAPPLHIGPAPAQLDVAGMASAVVTALCTEGE